MADPRPKIVEQEAARYKNLHPWNKPDISLIKQGRPLEPLFEKEVSRQYSLFVHHGLSNQLAAESVAEILGCRTDTVQRVVKKRFLDDRMEELQNKIKQEVYEDKIPLLKDIVGMSLQQVKESLQELAKDPERKAKMSIRDIRDLAGVGRELNDLLRLELGQSTENIAVKTVTHSHQSMHVLLEDLRKMDPVFEYPKLEAPKNEQE